MTLREMVNQPLGGTEVTGVTRVVVPEVVSSLRPLAVVDEKVFLPPLGARSWTRTGLDSLESPYSFSHVHE